MASHAPKDLLTRTPSPRKALLALMALGLLCGLTPRLAAQGPGEEWAELEGDLMEAQEESLRQGVPLMVFVIGEKQEEKVLALLKEEWFVEASKDFLLLVADPKAHEFTRIRNKTGRGSKYILACKVFRNAPCTKHQAALRTLQKELGLPKDREGKTLLPELLFLSPDQHILSHWGKLLSKDRLRNEMKLAQRRLDQGFAEGEREALQKQFAHLRKRFLKAHTARLKVAGNDLMSLPYPAARRFLQDVALGRIKKVRRPHRVTAIQVLSLRGSYDALPPLIAALDDSDIRVRDAALEGLAEVRLSRAAPDILKKAASWKKPAHQDKLALALIRSDPDSPKVQAWFEKILSQGRPKDRLEVLDALLLFEHPDDHWRKLVEAATSIRNIRVQEKAARVLATFESRK